MSRSRGKFSAYEFNEEEERIEKRSQDIVKKYQPKNPKMSGSSNDDHTSIDKYTFLEFFGKQNMDHCKDTSHEPVDIDAIEDAVKGRASGLDAYALSSSSNYKTAVHSRSNDRDARDVISGANFYAIRGTKVGVASSSSNLRENTQNHFLSDNELIGITSDDDDSTESTCKSYHADSEGLLEEQAVANGVGGCEFGISVVVDPNCILYGKLFFLNSRLTFSSNYIKLEGSSLYDNKGPLSFEWRVVDIISIESQWSNNLLTASLQIHLKSKDTKVAINAKNPDIVELNFDVTHPNWSKIEYGIRALNVRYKDTWNTIFHIDAAGKEDVSMGKSSKHLCSDFDEPFEEVIYPKGDHDAVSICKRDIQLLQPETFINDTIIDFYMKYLKNKLKHEEMHRFHLFNSFFFRKLADLDKDPSRVREGNVAFERVRKWTRKVNLFEKDYIFIPVNFRFHWSLIVICHPGEVVKLKDEKMKTLLKVPCILHMDSIKGSHRGLKNLFQSYLLEEWKERHKELVEDVSSKFWNLPFLDLELPQQENSFDCGLFLLHYAELFMENAPANFNPSRISKSNDFLRKDWFAPAEASLKRALMKKLIYEIAENNSRRVSASDERDSSESAGVDQSFNGKEFLHENCNSADTCHDSYSNSTVDKEFDTTPLAANPLPSLPWYEPNALYDPGDNARSLTVGDYHPERQIVLYNPSKNVMSPIEECEEADDPTSATSYRAKELKATESQLPPGNYVNCEEVEIPPETIPICGPKPLLELQVSGDRKPELLDSDPEEDKDIYECSSTSSDEFVTCVVEDSQEIIGTQDANECQGSAIERDKCVSSDQEANSVAVTRLPADQMPSDGLEACVISDSEEEQPESPGINVKCGSSSHQVDDTIALPNQKANFIQITDSTEGHSPVSVIKGRRAAKRPRAMVLEGELPLSKRPHMIMLD